MSNSKTSQGAWDEEKARELGERIDYLLEFAETELPRIQKEAELKRFAANFICDAAGGYRHYR